MWKSSIYLLILVLLVSGLLVPHVFASDSCVAIQPYFCLPTTNGFTLDSYGTTVNWADTIYYLSYSLFSDHINFTSASLSTPTNPSWSFGLGQNANGNLEITGLTSSQVNVTISSGNFSFYYASLPSYVTVNGTTVFSPSYYTTLSGFDSALAPSVLLNTTTKALEVNSGAKSTTWVAFYLATFPNGNTQSQTQLTSTKFAPTSLSISSTSISMNPNQSKTITVTADNSANPTQSTIQSINFSYIPKGLTITPDFSTPYMVGAYQKASLQFTVAASSSVSSGNQIATLTAILSGNTQTSFQIDVTVNGPSQSPLLFLTSEIGLSIIIIVIVTVSSGVIIKKKLED